MNLLGLVLGILTAMSFLISGCQSAASGGNSNAREQWIDHSKSDQSAVEVSESTVSGDWYGACVRDEDRDEFFRIDRMVLAKQTLYLTNEYFADSGCRRAMYTQKISGKYELNDEKKIDFLFEKLEMLPKASIIAAGFNQFDGFCGLKNWQPGRSQSFTEVSVCGLVPRFQMGIERFGNNELFLDGRKFVLSKKTTELDP